MPSNPENITNGVHAPSVMDINTTTTDGITNVHKVVLVDFMTTLIQDINYTIDGTPPVFMM